MSLGGEVMKAFIGKSLIIDAMKTLVVFSQMTGSLPNSAPTNGHNFDKIYKMVTQFNSLVSNNARFTFDKVFNM